MTAPSISNATPWHKQLPRSKLFSLGSFFSVSGEHQDRIPRLARNQALPRVPDMRLLAGHRRFSDAAYLLRKTK